MIVCVCHCNATSVRFITAAHFPFSAALRLDGVCSLDADPGPCQAYIPRFFYNSTSMKCERFIYGGCAGNANNYESKEDCLECCGEFCCTLIVSVFSEHL